MSPQGNRPAVLDAPRVVESSVAAGPGSARSAKTANSERAFFQLDLMRSLQLHRRLALSIAAVGLVLGLIYYFSMAPVYMAQCLVYVQPAPPSVIQQGYASRWPYDSVTYDSYIQQQVGNAMREDVLTSALKKLGDAGRKPNESDEDALNGLRRQLSVARVGQTYQFFIEARTSSPELAAQTANAVAASYIESTSHDQRAGDQQRLTMLREERDRVQSALDADRAEQQDLNKQLGVASIGGAPDHFDQDITEVRTELVKARTEHDAAEAKFAAMGASRGASSNAIDAAADESADTDAGLISMKTALNTRKAALISKMANLTPGNPEYKQDAAELAQINGNLEQMMKDLRTRAASHIQLQLRSELERTAGVEAQINTQLRQLVSNATNATSKLQRASDLVADITRLQSRYSSVDEQLHNLMLEDAAPSGAYVSTPADVPNHRAKSGRTRNALVIVMAGLFIGLIAAVVRHKMDRHVYVGSDLESVLGFGPMALLPDFSEVSDGAAEEHLLRLAAAIEHAHKQGRLRNCVFTGADSGTGVTTIVTRVRALLEAMGRPTVYVDASGTSAGEDHAEAPGLQGTKALATTGGGSRQTALSYRMANEGDDQTMVLTDAAPIAVSAETEYLARFADCAIVVVESGVTTRAEIRDAAATLQRLNVGAVGFVLNRVGLAKADPAFRSSVAAIEKHLQSQMGASARRPKRTEAVVAAIVIEPAIKPAEVSLSVPVAQAQVEKTSPQTKSEEPVAVAEPSWMSNTDRISSVEPPVLRTWTQFWPPPGSPSTDATATPAETVFGAHSLRTEPVTSNESMNRPQPASMRQSEPASDTSFAAAVAPRTESQQVHEKDPQRNVEASVGSNNFEREQQSVTPEFTSSETLTGPVPVVHQWMWAQRESLPVAAQPDMPRGGESPTVPVAQVPPEKPMPEADPDIPWWLSDIPGQRAEQPIPLLWQEEKKGKSRKNSPRLQSDPVESLQHADPSRNKGTGTPAPQSLSERSVGLQGYPGSQPAQASTNLTEPEESPERLTSRLSGLRSLLTGLGLKEAHSSAETLAPQSPHRTPLDRGSAAAEVSNRGLQGIAQSTSPLYQAAGAGTREVSVQPEFLKPTTAVAEYPVGDSEAGKKSIAKAFQHSSEFEGPTLPSRRGQYRNL
jgi:succinoglycan biosynthesis transport protein ExoP